MKILPIKLDDSLHLKLQLAASLAGKKRMEYVIDALKEAVERDAKKEAQQ